MNTFKKYYHEPNVLSGQMANGYMEMPQHQETVNQKTQHISIFTQPYVGKKNTQFRQGQILVQMSLYW